LSTQKRKKLKKKQNGEQKTRMRWGKISFVSTKDLETKKTFLSKNVRAVVLYLKTQTKKETFTFFDFAVVFKIIFFHFSFLIRLARKKDGQYAVS